MVEGRGYAPIEVRMTFLHRATARAKMRALIDSRPERVVVAHGEMVRSGGADYLRRAFSWLPRRPYRVKNYLEAMEYIGFGSLPIILLVGLFTGAVTSLQSVNAFRVFGFESFSGGATGKALSIELAPVLT